MRKDLPDVLVERMRQAAEHTKTDNYRFKDREKIRIKKTIDTDTYNIEDMLGKMGFVVRRYSDADGQNWYDIRCGNRVEPFKEYELGKLNQHTILVPQMLSSDEAEELLEEATEARESAYAPYSGFKVGAVVLAKSGKTYPGANIERVTHDATHAERYALDSAVLAGEREIRAVALVLDAPEPIFPCGKCRQDLAEFDDGKGELIIVTANLSGHKIFAYLKNLLPERFGPIDLGKDPKDY
jgi:cytidine deaminase